MWRQLWVSFKAHLCPPAASDSAEVLASGKINVEAKGQYKVAPSPIRMFFYTSLSQLREQQRGLNSRERERDRERERERKKEREEKITETERSERERGRIYRQAGRQTDRQRPPETDRDRQQETERQTETETGRQTDRH